MRNMWHMGLRTVVNRIAVAAVVATMFVGGSVVAGASAAESNRVPSASSPETANGRVVHQSLVGFDPGNIIDDAVFFNSGSMGEAAVQSFLNARVPNCQSGYVCLKSFHQTTQTREATALCGRYQGAASESAARIITKVAQACGINPQVIIVTLQKEQGLVTHTWPSDWRYTIAMGQGCPDTAACDTRYYGFFNQVYGAAAQFKRYANPPGTSNYFTWYAPGRTWNVRFHPNAACGTSPVTIRNQATANLYYYTPYQPNAAALAAGYGAANNACSSYGNRNFYNYFTDWFGSTRGAQMNLIKVSSSATVYLNALGKRWSIASVHDWIELNRVFGPTQVVSDSYLASLPNAGPATAIVRNALSGEIALIQDGQTHQFSSCEAVQAWGASCANPVNLSAGVFSAVPRGAMMTEFFQVASTGRWGRMAGAAPEMYYDRAAAEYANRGVEPYAARIPELVLSKLSPQPLMFAPATLVKTTDAAMVYVTDVGGRLVAVPSFGMTDALGMRVSELRTVSPADLSAYRWNKTDMVTGVVTCLSTTYIGAQGRLHPLADPSSVGLASFALSDDACRRLSLATTRLESVFAKSPRSDVVYQLVNGSKVPFASWKALVQANGGAVPTILTVSDDLLTPLPTAALRFADGDLIKGDQSPVVFVVSSGSLVPLPSFDAARELGLSTNFVVRPQKEIEGYRLAPMLTTWIRCGDSTDVHIAASGTLHRLASPALAQGFAVSSLSSALCNSRPTAAPVLSSVFVKSAGVTVFAAQSGELRPVTSWTALLRLNGGSAPTILTVSDSTIRSIPVGQPIA